MKRHKHWIAMIAGAALMALMAGSFLAQQPATTTAKDEVALRAAMEKETVQGDLKGAIEQYKKVAQSKDRSIVARAIVRMAECYQKLGNAEARGLYERVVREFADQKEPVALARARLDGTDRSSAIKGDRAIWAGANVDWYGSVSSDGRFISFVDWNDGRLMLHDIQANTDRPLTLAVPDYEENAEWSAISKDGKQIAYDWSGEQGRTDLRVASLEGRGFRFLEPRVLNKSYYSPMEWSPDGKWIAGVSQNRERANAEIGLISVADGSFRSLKTVDLSVIRTSRNKTSIRFSPDGKYIAYDRVASEESAQRDVFVLPVNGASEIPAVVNNANDLLMDWSPDGKWLLFTSDRAGSVGLWGLAFADGKFQGLPTPLKPDVGPIYSLGVTDSGAMLAHKSINNRDIVIAPIDIAAGKLAGPPAIFAQGFIEGSRNPQWSPDGKYLAYPVPCRVGTGCMAIRSVATGQVRRVAPTLSQVNGGNWAPDGRSIIARGQDARGTVKIFKIDVQSGGAAVLIDGEGLGNGPQWSVDGKKVYFIRSGITYERDLASGTERRLYDGPVSSYRSPDGKYILTKRTDAATKTSTLILIPLAGGPPRELLRLTEPEVFAPQEMFTPDSSGVIVTKRIGSRRELWLLPIAVGSPRKLDIDPDIWLDGNSGGGDLSFSLSPDGRHVAFQMGKAVSEVWVLENFLPKSSAKR
jgi:Tol biopolymer transport system component